MAMLRSRSKGSKRRSRVDREPTEHQGARVARRRRVGPAERRALHGEVTDPAEVLAAAARYLEARPRAAG